jgi:hypothetical protein
MNQKLCFHMLRYSTRFSAAHTNGGVADVQVMYDTRCTSRFVLWLPVFELKSTASTAAGEKGKRGESSRGAIEGVPVAVMIASAAENTA